MVKYVYVGLENYQKGKPLWEILGNLQNMGVGRLITRQAFLRYPEPSFYKIVKVEAQHPPDDIHQFRKCVAWVEFTFRGNLQPVYRELWRATYKPDYQLIPKSDEEELFKRAKEFKQPIKLIHPYVKMPSLLKEIVVAEKKKKGESVTEELELKVKIATGLNNAYRECQKGETPTQFIESGLGTPKSPALYANVEAARELFVGVKAWDDPPQTKATPWFD